MPRLYRRKTDVAAIITLACLLGGLLVVTLAVLTG